MIAVPRWITGVLMLLFLASPGLHAAAKVNTIRLQSNPPVRSGQSFLATFDLARTGTTPSSMRVSFYLVDPDGYLHQSLGTNVYSTPAVRTISLTARGPFYGPATGWRLAAKEDTQPDYTLSPTFAVEQSPPKMDFVAVSGGDRLVIGKSSSATVDSTNFTTAENVYFRFQIRNTGEATASGYYLRAKLNGMVLEDAALGAHVGSGSLGVLTANLPPQPAGSYTLTLELLGGNGSGDSVSQSFTVASLIDLLPSTPPSWSAPVVAATAVGARTDAALLTVRDEVYLSLGFLNQGSAAAGAFKVRVILNGQEHSFYVIGGGLAANARGSVPDIHLGRLAEGRHEVQVIVDSDFQVVEFNEGNNSYWKTLEIREAKMVVEGEAGMIASGENLAFGITTRQVEMVVSLTIRNPGGAPLTIPESGIAVEGLHAGDFAVASAPQSLLGPGDSTTMSVRFTPTALGSRTAVMRITNDAGVTNIPFVLILEGIAEREMEAWRRLYFPGSSASSGEGADDSAPRGDGVANLLKYGLGMDPTKAEALPVEMSLDAEGVLEYGYPRSKAAVRDGLIFRVEWSEDLSSGEWSEEGVTVEVIERGEIEWVTATVPASESARKFVRLVVESPQEVAP